MSLKPNHEFAKKNLNKAVSFIPIKLIEKEDKLLRIVKDIPKNPMSKLNYLYNFMADLYKPFQHLTPCKSGCSHCCYIKIDVSSLEILNIKKNAKSIVKNIPKGKKIGESCPFLKNDSCSIYKYRPFTCRRHQIFLDTNIFCKEENDVGQQLLQFSEVDKSFSFILSEHGDLSMKDIRTYFQ